jgi:hypothetical protein
MIIIDDIIIIIIITALTCYRCFECVYLIVFVNESLIIISIIVIVLKRAQRILTVECSILISDKAHSAMARPMSIQRQY